MKKTKLTILEFKLVVFIGGALALMSPSLNAQEALRSAVQGDLAYEARTAPDFRPRDERMRIGPVHFALGASYALEWTDNVRLRPEGSRESDFMHLPQVNLRAVWPATKESTVSVGAGIGYRFYMDNSELNRLTVTPDSELAWDIPIEDVLITLFDRVSYSEDVASEGGLSGQAQYPRLENTVGARVKWRPDPWLFEAGYSHFNFVSDTAGFDYLSRSAEQFFGRVAYQIAAITHVGIEASGALTDYDAPEQSDNQNVSVGPFLVWQALRDLRITARGGYVVYFYDPSPVQITNGLDQLDSYYFGLDFRHQLTDFISHSLAINRSVQQGVNQGSQASERLNLNYGINWAFHDRASLSASGFYEQGEETRSGFPEEYDRYGASVGVTVRPLGRLSVSLSYRYTEKDSNFVTLNNDYWQNTVTLTARYQF